MATKKLKFEFKTACEAMLHRLGAVPGTHRDLMIPTVAGPLQCTAYPDWLACVFDDVNAARARVGAGTLNPFSGKLNWMYDKPGPQDLVHLYEQVARVVVPDGEVAEMLQEYTDTLLQLNGKGDVNTRLTYMYRDADNYKVGKEVVFKGIFRLGEDLAPMLLALDRSEGSTSLIPGQVGLDDLQDSFTGCASRWDPERDHPWHEVTSVAPVLAAELPATDGRSIFEFSRDVIRAAVGDGWNEAYLPPFHAVMMARQSRHERESGG